MARKRMLSPEIWESESFSSLSDLGKIVFIGLISLSDDEGRGRASASYIKSTLFPYDEHRRVAEVKSALSEIARCTSTQFYNVNGNDYYMLTNWTKWQKVDRPSKSKLPAPPDSGVGGLYPENEENLKFGEHSANIRRTLGEGSSPNRIEKNRIERNRIERNACAGAHVREGQALVSLDKIYSIFPSINIPKGYKPKRKEEDYIKAKEEIEKSDFAKKVFVSLKDIDAHFDEIVLGKYKNFSKDESGSVEKSYTAEQLNAQFEDLSYDDI